MVEPVMVELVMVMAGTAAKAIAQGAWKRVWVRNRLVCRKPHKTVEYWGD